MANESISLIVKLSPVCGKGTTFLSKMSVLSALIYKTKLLGQIHNKIKLKCYTNSGCKIQKIGSSWRILGPKKEWMPTRGALPERKPQRRFFETFLFTK